MSPKDKAEQLVNEYRILLMNEDTECGNEILCTIIAKQCALIAVDLMIEEVNHWLPRIIYLRKVKEEINKL